MLSCEIPSSFGSLVCVNTYATGSACVYMPQSGQPEKGVCPNKTAKEGKPIYRMKSSPVIYVCTRSSAGRVLHTTFYWTQSFFQISLWGKAITLRPCPRHHDATFIQQSVYALACTSEIMDLRPFLHRRGRSCSGPKPSNFLCQRSGRETAPDT